MNLTTLVLRAPIDSPLVWYYVLIVFENFFEFSSTLRLFCDIAFRLRQETRHRLLKLDGYQADCLPPDSINESRGQLLLTRFKKFDM